MRPTSPPIALDRLLTWLAVGCLCSGPLWLGGASARAATLVGGVIVVGTSLAAWLARRSGWKPDSTWSGGVVVAAVWTALQAISLPIDWVTRFAPRAADHARQAADLLGEAAPTWATLSEDPGRTRAALTTSLMVVAAAWAASALVRAGARRTLLRGALAVSASLIAIAMVHAVLGLERLGGIYAPRFANPTFLTPLLNDNHLAAVLAASVPLAWAESLRARQRRERNAWLFLALLLAAFSVGTLSRSALPTLLVGVVTFGIASRRRGSSWRLVAGGIVVAVGAVAFVGAERYLRAAADTDLSKLELIAESSRLLTAAPWTGVGRGAFTVAFAQVHGVDWRYTQPESWPVLWLVEWGLLFGVGVGYLLARPIVAALRSGSRSRAAAASALVALVCHDVVDFSLELPGIASWAAVLFGVAISPRSATAAVAANPSGWSQPSSWLGAAAGVVALSLVGLVGRDPQRAEDEVRRGLLAGEPMAEVVNAAVRSHPGEPTFVLLGAAQRTHERSDEAPRWLNRAMALAPHWPSPHVLAADYLAARGRMGQARLELREAAKIEPRSVRDVVCRYISSSASLDAVSQTVPEGPKSARVATLELVSACLREGATREEIDRWILDIEPEHPGASRRVARRERVAGDPTAAWGRLLNSFAGHEGDLGLLQDLIELAVEREALDEGAGVLERARRRLPEDPRVEALTARLAQARGDHEAMVAAVERMRGLSRGSIHHIAESYRTLARLEERMGNLFQAVSAWEEAWQLSRSDRDLDELVRAARQTGSQAHLRGALERSCRERGPTSAACGELRESSPRPRQPTQPPIP